MNDGLALELVYAKSQIEVLQKENDKLRAEIEELISTKVDKTLRNYVFITDKEAELGDKVYIINKEKAHKFEAYDECIVYDFYGDGVIGAKGGEKYTGFLLRKGDYVVKSKLQIF